MTYDDINYTIVTDDGFQDDHWPKKDGVYLDTCYLDGDDDPADAITRSQGHARVMITFGGAHDGRGFSLARQLRDAGYMGHIRAKGPLVTDQWRHLRQTGFNSLMLTPQQVAKMPLSAWQDVQNLILPDYRKRIFMREAGEYRGH